MADFDNSMVPYIRYTAIHVIKSIKWLALPLLYSLISRPIIQ